MYGKWTNLFSLENKQMETASDPHICVYVYTIHVVFRRKGVLWLFLFRAHNAGFYLTDADQLTPRLLLCVSICGSIALVNLFSSCVLRRLLLCGSASFGHALEFTLTCQPNPVLVENADAC